MQTILYLEQSSQDVSTDTGKRTISVRYAKYYYKCVYTCVRYKLSILCVYVLGIVYTSL